MERSGQNSRYQNISASANNLASDTIDCGITKLKWCTGAKCQKFASLKWFVIILSLVGMLQGATISYFRISAKQAAVTYGYDSVIVDWLLVSNGLFQAYFALFYAHWAHKFHPISWLGGTTVLQGIVCAISIIPAILTPISDIAPISTVETPLCSQTGVTPVLKQLSKITLDEDQGRMGTLVLLFVLQFAIGMGNLAFFVIGVTYIDDNSQSIDSPAAIGAALCVSIAGIQFGYFISMITTITSTSWWMGWVILGPLIFIFGILIGLFPRRLVKTVLHQTAQRIIEESSQQTFGSRMSAYIDDTDFFPTLKRLFGNKLLMCNTIGLIFILCGIFNYNAQEESYLRSRFFIPFSEENGLIDEWNQKFVSYFLIPPFAGLGALVSGLVISKLKLSARTITVKNIVFGIILVGMFSSLVYMRCDIGPIAGFSMGKLAQPYCSKQCICSPNTFLPVCPENSTVTYFSPCYAGCKTQSFINDVAIYEGCTCAMDTETTWTRMRATEGACNASNCRKMWFLFQAMSMSIASLLASTLIGKIIVSFRSVLPQDKPMALAMKVLFVGLISFGPGKFGYDLISSKTCIYWSQNFENCLLRESPLHGNILNILTAALIFIGVIFDIMVFVFAKNVKLYNCKVTDPDYNQGILNETSINNIPVTRGVYTPISSEAPESPESASPAKTLRQLRPAPKPFVYRSPSSITSSSTDQEIPLNGITYAKLDFPSGSKNDKSDENLDLRMQPVKANVPLHHLSEQDVRAQLGTLKSFSPNKSISELNKNEEKINEIRPISPETDF